MNKRKVGADGELFSLDFPVAIPNVQKKSSASSQDELGDTDDIISQRDHTKSW